MRIYFTDGSDITQGSLKKFAEEFFITKRTRILEWFGMEGTFKDHLVPTFLQWAGT